MRVGFGYDVHAFVEDRPLILGGWRFLIPMVCLDTPMPTCFFMRSVMRFWERPPLGDIGRHFPDSDPAYKGISSLILLERTVSLIREHGFEIENMDALWCCKNPAWLLIFSQMVENISRAANVPRTRVNVKATTTERLGFTGREEGIAAYAVALLRKRLMTCGEGARFTPSSSFQSLKATRAGRFQEGIIFCE